jgi:hypothetical protein
MAVGCFLLFGVVSCEKQGDKRVHTAPSPWDQIEVLKAQLDLLRADVKTQEFTQELYLDDLRSMLSGAKPVEIDVTQKSYTPIHTPSGLLFIQCMGAEPYLNGHKLKLAIGNPLLATFNGFKLKCLYGPKQPPMPTGPYEPKTWQQYREASDKSLKSRRETEARFTETIGAGFWKEVELILVPSSAEELGMITIAMEIDAVHLRN